MVFGKYISAVSGVSKRDGVTPWYRFEFVVNCIDSNGSSNANNMRVVTFFGTEKAYNECMALHLKPMVSDCTLTFGVNSGGHVVLNGVRASAGGTSV